METSSYRQVCRRITSTRIFPCRLEQVSANSASVSKGRTGRTGPKVRRKRRGCKEAESENKRLETVLRRSKKNPALSVPPATRGRESCAPVPVPPGKSSTPSDREADRCTRPVPSPPRQSSPPSDREVDRWTRLLPTSPRNSSPLSDREADR